MRGPAARAGGRRESAGRSEGGSPQAPRRSGADATNVTLTFDDDAALELDPLEPLISGTYRPLDIGADVFPAPAPADSGARLLQVFTGTNPNGIWSLFVNDDTANEGGSIAGGWAIDFVIAREFCNPTPITINDNAAGTPYPSPIVEAMVAAMSS